MSVCKFDTFENETEISQMIKKFQEKNSMLGKMIRNNC